MATSCAGYGDRGANAEARSTRAAFDRGSREVWASGSSTTTRTRDPWWCPVHIAGLGKRQLERVPGEDSLQALILALELVTHVLPIEADRAGAHLQWLGERESLIFANTFTSSLLARNLQNCITSLADAVDVLETVSTGAATRTRTTARRLRALVASGGHTAASR